VPKTSESKRLPRTAPARSIHAWPSIRLHPAHRAGPRWVIRGSRPLSHVSAVLTLRRNSLGDRAHAKAAPLQAPGDRISHDRTTLFEGRLRLGSPTLTLLRTALELLLLLRRTNSAWLRLGRLRIHEIALKRPGTIQPSLTMDLDPLCLAERVPVADL